MAERNVKLTIAYDGSGYSGWQRQSDGFATVQQTLEEVMLRIVKQPVTLRASGRTDTGVHAAGQVANFFTDTSIPTARLAHAINSRLPRDIRIIKSEEVSDDFDSILSAKSKLYRYTVFNHLNLPPYADKYCHHFYLKCDLASLQAAAEKITGEHDFASFASSGSVRQSTVRHVLRCQVWKKFHWLFFDLEGTGFLYHMVRNIVGTLLEIGRGYWEPAHMEEILAARQRSVAGPMAPPNGLCLQWVKY